MFRRQVDSLADGATAAAGLMTSNGHVVVQVQNIGDSEPLVLNLGAFL